MSEKSYILDELIEKEESYIRKLKDIHRYMAVYVDEDSDIPLPLELKNVSNQLIFANVTEIYKWHKCYFLNALKDNRDSIRDLTKILVDNEPQFHMYSQFAYNSNIRQHLLDSHVQYFDQLQDKLECKESLKDLLVTTAQRHITYKMLFGRLLDCLIKTGCQTEAEHCRLAVDMIERVAVEWNGYMKSQYIENFDCVLSDQGKLLFHEFLLCTHNCKTRKLYAFLFKRSIVFTKSKKTKDKFSERYIYQFKLAMNKIRILQLPGCKFLLQMEDPNQAPVKVVCEPESNALYDHWVEVIGKQLMLQKKLISSIMYPVDDNVEEREICM
ncbi:hypothetical protein DOY81_006382 [Sarcophaga bullata]|nr:hypothetical protein DOY81_006382 [Sarcophaga bullata]